MPLIDTILVAAGVWVGMFFLCFITDRLMKLYRNHMRKKHGPENWTMIHGDVIQRERCKYCNITFPDVYSTTDLV